ncbi:MAG: fibronectin type III domain-containing protein [Deltaproteobacteria bacterium]|nr:fibronectin type III domain-containing protein [Deltaproteobacteria bacterium]
MINWNTVSGATSYNIYWSTTSGVTTANGTKISGVTNPYIHTGRVNGTTYYYIVTAVNSYGESVASNQVFAAPSISGTPPAAPIGVTATPGNGQVTISWNTVIGVASYNVYDSTNSGGPYIKVSSATSTNHTISGLNNGTMYYFVVTAVNSYGESGNSTEVFATPTSGGTGIPAAPTGVTVEYITSFNFLFVSWNSVVGASTYNIYFSTTAGTEKTSGIPITGISRTSYSGTQSLTNGLIYYFVVTAVNSYGESAPSSEVSIVAGMPASPYSVTAASDCSGNVTITWYDWDSSVTSYNVYYSTTSGTEQTSGLEISGVTNTGTTITGLTKGTSYYFVVTAVNSVGESAPSPEVSVIAGTPPPPAVVSATAGNAQVTINWSSVSCATSYNIYWATYSGVSPQTGIQITSVTSPYLQTGLTNGVAYYYVVTAVDSYGEGAPSQEVYAIAGAYTYTVGTFPFGIAIDKSGNVWVTNNNVFGGGNTISEITYSGSTISSYTVGINPAGIAIDASGNIWVVNSRGSCLTCSSNGTVTELNSSGSIINTHAVGFTPTGIAIDASGNVWVTNNGGNTVSEITYGGSTINTYTVGFNPQGIAIDKSGNIWVVNSCGSDSTCSSNGTVTELNSSGNTINTYAIENQSWFSNLIGNIAIDASGNVWVTNNGGNTVSEITYGGSTINSYTVGFGPAGIAIDASGNIWVTNLGGTITELDSSGSTIDTYVGAGGLPLGIAIDSSGDVWVTNAYLSSIGSVTEYTGGLATGPQYWPYTGPIWP